MYSIIIKYLRGYR